MPDIVHPFVHLNGTSRKELLSLRQDARLAIKAAQQALADMGPNARDYYPIPGSWELALAQHGQRVTLLAELYKAIEEEAYKLQEEE